MEEKKRGGRPKGAKDKTKRKPRQDKNGWDALHNPELPEGYNARLVSFLEEVAPKEPISADNVPEMKRRFRHYLEMCKKYDMKIANLQAYRAIGFSKEQVHVFIVHRSRNPERADFLEFVRQTCGAYREALANDGKIRDAIAIFYGKNYDGLKDQQEVVVSASPLDDGVSAEELERKYLESANLGDTKAIETTVQESVPLQLPETETAEN